MRSPDMRTRPAPGFTLIELMIVVAIMGAVILSITSILISSSHSESRTVRRARVQGDCRQAIYLMSTEIRQAGADPSDPPVGIVGLVSGDSISIRVRADLNGNGTIETAEPSEDVTYSYDSTARVIKRNPGSGAVTVMSNVNTMTLSYFDDTNTAVTPLPLSSTDAARVRSVGLTITAEDQDSKPLTLNSRITLRNNN
jgi:type IV pilus assembly protein PilW